MQNDAISIDGNMCYNCIFTGYVFMYMCIWYVFLYREYCACLCNVLSPKGTLGKERNKSVNYFQVILIAFDELNRGICTFVYV